jgi:hypothetical protein
VSDFVETTAFEQFMELCEPGIVGELRGPLLVVPLDKGLDRVDGS